MKKIEVDGISGTLVHLGGIAHFVLENAAPDCACFARVESVFASYPELEAYGVIFLNGDRMTPLVKVPAAGTLTFEGSCGSGTLAASIARSEGADGEFSATLIQPAGTVTASVERKNGAVIAATIGGPVTVEDPIIVEV